MASSLQKVTVFSTIYLIRDTCRGVFRYMINVLSVLLSAAPLEHIVFSCGPHTPMKSHMRNSLIAVLKDVAGVFEEVLSGSDIQSVELRICDHRIPTDYYRSELVGSYPRLHARGIFSITKVACKYWFLDDML